jgi:hypothetical protein
MVDKNDIKFLNVITDCIDCGVDLTDSEINNGEVSCYPCQKGNQDDEEDE